MGSEMCIRDRQPNLFAITESWLTESITDDFLSIDSCTLYRNDRSDGRVGGGVAVWASSSLQFNRHQSCGPEFGTNSVWLLEHKTKLCFICVYIPPSVVQSCASDVLDFLSFNLDTVLMKHPNYNVNITGDFNRLNVNRLLDLSLIHI